MFISSKYDFRSVVVLANYYQFYRGERLASFHSVKSRMLLWCKAGLGCVIVNGRTFELSAGVALFLPWEHAIRYQADPKDPFLVGGVHIIPDHAFGKTVVFKVAHGAKDSLYQSPYRRDRFLERLEGILHGVFSLSHPLLYLADYIVQRAIQHPWIESDARLLARVLLLELESAFSHVVKEKADWPVSLQQMVQFEKNHLSTPISLMDLVHFSGLSPATIGRLFKKHLSCTPVQYIARSKMKAAERLLRSSRMQISEVGCAIGIRDPFYFSKLYKRVTGRTPSEDRRKAKLV